MHQDHQAGVAQQPRHGQALTRSQTSVLKAALQVDLAAAAGEGGLAEGRDFREDAIAAPAIGQRPEQHGTGDGDAVGRRP